MTQRASLFAAAAMIALGWVPAALATPCVATTRADALILSGGVRIDRETDSIPPTGNVSASGAGINSRGAPYNGSAAAYVDASCGHLRLSNSANMTGSGQATGTSSIGIHDTWNFSQSSFNGQTAVITVALLVTGSLSASNNLVSTAQSRYDLVFTTDTGTTFQLASYAFDGGPGGTTYFCNHDGAQSAFADCYGEMLFDVTFTLGSDLGMSLDFSAFSSVVGNSAAHVAGAAADFANSLYWGGFSNLRVGGTTLTDYVFASGSGFDWNRSYFPTNGVPEPGSLWLLALALVAMLAGKRRRARMSAA